MAQCIWKGHKEVFQYIGDEIPRIMVVDGDRVLIGFNEKEWEAHFSNGGKA